MNRFTPYQAGRDKKKVFSYDRNCQDCGVLIRGAAHQKPMECFKCKGPQLGRLGWDHQGWGRCVECDSWMNRNHCFCLCGYAYNEAIQRRRQQKEAARQQEIFRKEQETADLRRQLGEATRANMVLQQQIDERAQGDQQREENHVFAQEIEGVDLEDANE